MPPEAGPRPHAKREARGPAAVSGRQLVEPRQIPFKPPDTPQP